MSAADPDLVDQLFDRYLELELEGEEDAIALALAEAPDDVTRDALRRQIELDREVLSAVPDVLDVNQRLGNYRLIEEIARGGQGIVYRAEQSSLNRDVAIKVLPPDRSQSREHRKKLAQESMLLGGLQHPAIASAIELLTTDRGLCLVMGYLPHPSLQRILELAGQEQVSPLEIVRRHCTAAGSASVDPVQLCCRMIETAARGLDAAHRAGVLHGDVKPSNILLNKEGHPYLIDFGLAQLQGPRDEHGLSIHGTLPYVAPEVLQRGQGALAPASDVYGLAATLYELLCGQPIFRAERFLDLLRLAKDETVPPLRTRAKHLPPELDLILRRALARDPEQRTKTALAFAEELERFREGRPLDATGEPLGMRLRLAWRVARKRHRLWVGAGVAAALIVSFTIFLWPSSSFKLATKSFGNGDVSAALQLIIASRRDGSYQPRSLGEFVPLIAAHLGDAVRFDRRAEAEEMLRILSEHRNLEDEEMRLQAELSGLAVVEVPSSVQVSHLSSTDWLGAEQWPVERVEARQASDGSFWFAVRPGYWRAFYTHRGPGGERPSVLLKPGSEPPGFRSKVPPIWPYRDDDRVPWVKIHPELAYLGTSRVDAANISYANDGTLAIVRSTYWMQREEFSVERLNRYLSDLASYEDSRSMPPFAHPDDPDPFAARKLRFDSEALGDKPAGFLSFYDAFAIATWAYGRLPTEHEWEHAARRGRSAESPYFAEPLTETKELGRWPVEIAPSDFIDKMGDVGVDPMFDPNALFLHLHDNVGEWTSSLAAPHPGGIHSVEGVCAILKGLALQDSDPDLFGFPKRLTPAWTRRAVAANQRGKRRSWHGLRLVSDRWGD